MEVKEERGKAHFLFFILLIILTTIDIHEFQIVVLLRTNQFLKKVQKTRNVQHRNG